MAKLRVDKIAAPIVKDEFTGSVYFDGDGDYLAPADSSDFAFGTGDFTIECFNYFSDFSASLQTIFDTRKSDGSLGFAVFANNSGQWRVDAGTGDGISAGNAGNATSQIWQHIALTRESGTVKLFVDGVLKSSVSNTTDLTGQRLTIGFNYDRSSWPGHGYISNFRVCKGHAVYTENFTPPTRELEVHTKAPKGVVFPAADNRTVLLACQSSTDTTAEATGRHTITAAGNATAADANPGLLRKTNIFSKYSEDTGSVYFDGTGDYLKTASSNDFAYGTGDFTWEMWVYVESFSNNRYVLDHGDNGGTISNGDNGNTKFIYYNTTVGTGGELNTPGFGTLSTNTWYHLAAVRKDGTTFLYTNGVLTASQSDTHNYGEQSLNIGRYGGGGNEFNGYISNFRICKGHAVYTSNFTPPTKELDVHPQSVFLGLYDGENVFAEKTGKIIAANGDRLSSPTPTATDSPIGITTFQPGLIRDVDSTDGPTFQGGVGYNSQNWLTLPKGTTTERFPNFAGADSISARGVFGGGYSTSDIEYIQISTLGNSSEFGDRAHANQARPASLSSSTRGLFAGGFTPNTYSNTIDYITITTTGNGKDFGDMTDALWSRAGCSNSIRGIIAGGSDGSNSSIIEHLIISSTGNGHDFGDLTRARRELGGSSSTTRGIFMGGRSPVPSGQDNDENIIDYITIATTGNAVDFGDLTVGARTAGASCSNATRSLYSGGNSSNTIEFVTIATLGNSTNFGDMNNALNRLGSCASSTRGIIAGGSPTNNTIEYVTISTESGAIDFGDLNAGAKRDIAGLSNGHGGLG